VTGWNFACADWEQRLREGRSLVLQCPRCSGVIEEKHKFELNARGAYVAP
jgi:phage terminase large subunit GpA-like protein